MRWFALLFLIALTSLLPSCASEDKSNDPGVTSIPWNKPEGWESQGPMGGFTQQGR